jgi:hypothetical protein
LHSRIAAWKRSTESSPQRHSDLRNCQTLGVPRQSRGFTLMKLYLGMFGKINKILFGDGSQGGRF